MPRGFLSARIDAGNRFHHLWNNNGTWWIHYTLHWEFRKRRIRRSLGTADAEEALARRDAAFARIAAEGEEIPERRPSAGRPAPDGGRGLDGGLVPAGLAPARLAPCTAVA